MGVNSLVVSYDLKKFEVNNHQMMKGVLLKELKSRLQSVEYTGLFKPEQDLDIWLDLITTFLVEPSLIRVSARKSAV